MSQRAVAKISFAFEFGEKKTNPKHSLGAEGLFISTGNKGNELFEISQTVFDILSESCTSEPGQEWERWGGIPWKGEACKISSL